MHHYDVISDEDACESPDRTDNDSPVLCMDTILEDQHSDSLFDSDTESESDDVMDVCRGRMAKKTFKVKFGPIPF